MSSSAIPPDPDPRDRPIGLIGAGRMGQIILRCLLDAGHTLYVYDKSEEAISLASSWGANTLQSPVEISSLCEIILLCLPGPAETESIISGDTGLLQNLGEHHIVIDLSTSDPKTTARIAIEMDKVKASFLDAPILGRPASVGHWVLPIGGNPEALERCRSILETFAAQAIWVGQSGAGHTLKLLNQLMFSTINAITAEVLAICARTNLSPETLYDTITASGAATVSGLFRETGRKIVDRDFEPVFTIDLLHKDTHLGIKMATEHGAFPILAKAVQEHNEMARIQGYGGEDTSALVKVYEGLFD